MHLPRTRCRNEFPILITTVREEPRSPRKMAARTKEARHQTQVRRRPPNIRKYETRRGRPRSATKKKPWLGENEFVRSGSIAFRKRHKQINKYWPGTSSHSPFPSFHPRDLGADAAPAGARGSIFGLLSFRPPAVAVMAISYRRRFIFPPDFDSAESMARCRKQKHDACMKNFSALCKIDCVGVVLLVFYKRAIFIIGGAVLVIIS